MKKQLRHINQLISMALLMVFAIALTPFGALHHHEAEPVCSKNEKTCTHKLHVRTHTETCLICAAHFEKNYLHDEVHFQVYLETKPVTKFYSTVSGSYTELIGSALRGPPIA